MNKLFTKIASLCVGLMMTIGVGVSIAETGRDINPAYAAGNSYVETTLDNAVTNKQSIIIVSHKGSSAYAMSNSNGTGSAPAAVAVDISSGSLTTTQSNVLWDVTGNSSDGYTFNIAGDTSKWLYCTATNNGVRVGTNANKTFKIDSDYLKNTATSRYLGVYNNQDWRCYISINSNISGQEFKFYTASGEGSGLGGGDSGETPNNPPTQTVEPLIITSDYFGLTTTANTSEKTINGKDGTTYKLAPSSGNSFKKQNKSGNNAFSSEGAILIGKSGAYIYNTTPFTYPIQKFELFANGGASAKVSVAVNFGTSVLSTSNTNNGKPLSTTDSVYDFTTTTLSNSDCKYFRFQVTNANNSQVQFRITFKTTTPVTGLSLKSSNYTPVDGVVTLDKNSGTLTDTLTATVTPDNATNKNVNWTTNNSNIATVSNGTVSINTSTSGSATITATSADNSNISASITYDIVDAAAQEFSITANVTDGVYSGTNTILEETSETIKIIPNSGYKAPESIVVNNATLTSYDASTGTAVISNPTGDVTITAVCQPLANYTISVTASYCTYTGELTIQEKGSTTLTFTSESGYALPSTVTVDGASHTWNADNGQLVLSNPTSNVTVTVTAALFENTSSLEPGTYFIKYESYYFTGSISDGKGSSSTNVPGNAGKFTFKLIGNDKWNAINADGKYLSIGTSSTSLGLSSTPSETTTLKVADGSDGTFYVTGPSGRGVSWYSNNSEFRTYSGSSLTTVTLENAKTATDLVVDETNADKNVLVGTEFDADAASLAGFVATVKYDDGSSVDVTTLATWELDTTVENPNATLTVSYNGLNATVEGINVYVVTILSLEIDATNAKTSGYYVGETLDTTGVVITGLDNLGNSHSIDLALVEFNPTTLETAGQQTITVTYANNNETIATGTYSVSVSVFEGYLGLDSVEDIVCGDTYIIGFPSHGVTMGGEYADKYVRTANQTEFSVNGNGITFDNAQSSEASLITFLDAGEGKYCIYDLTNEKFLKGSASDAQFTICESLAEATAFVIEYNEGGFSISVTDGENTRYISYNVSSPRVAAYKNYSSQYPQPSLYKVEGSSLKDSVDAYCENSLHLADYNDELGWCNDNDHAYYTHAKEAYNNLSEAEKLLFQTSDDYSIAKARYEAWAYANNDANPYDGNNEVVSKINKYDSLMEITTENQPFIFVAILLSVVLIGCIAYSLKRKYITSK